MNVQVQRIDTAAEVKLADEFARLGSTLAGGDAMQSARAEAFNRYSAQGLPHRRVEEFKYTDIRARVREVPDAGDVEVVLAQPGAGVNARSLSDALDADGDTIASRLAARFTGFDSPMLDLNQAFASNGTVIDVAAGAQVEAPVRTSFTTPAGKRGDTVAVYTVGDGAKVTIIETVGADGEGAFGGHVSHLDIGKNADVTFIRHVHAGAAGIHSGGVAVTVDANTKFDSLLVVSSGELVRTDVGLRFTGEHSNANLRGLHLAGGTRHVDTTLFIDHAVPDCISRELFKSVLDDSARSVFQGKILVRKIAQKTDGKMMAQALMLSDEAEADSKPELEIYADDVQCGHGSTTGRVDDNFLFYLMTRGIPKRTATRMLVSAFAAEVFDDLDEEIVDEFSAVAEEWLERHLAG